METAIDHATGPGTTGSGPGPATGTSLVLERARRGDADAFESLYRSHHRQVHALSLRLTRDGRAAEELTQEVFVRAWRALPGFRGDSRLGTWLHTITVRANLERRRRMGRRADREASEEEVSGYAMVAKRAMPETAIDLERAIARVPDGAREVLLLHDVHGYKHREIGEMLGVAEGTAKAQLHRARKLIRRFMEGER